MWGVQVLEEQVDMERDVLPLSPCIRQARDLVGVQEWLRCLPRVCRVCDEKENSKYARGLGNLLRKDDIAQHARSRQHQEAFSIMQRRPCEDVAHERGVAQTARQEPDSASAIVAESANVEATNLPKQVVVRTPHSGVGFDAVVAARAMLETASSFLSLDVWLGALAHGEREALGSSWHCKRLVAAMAKHERIQTHRLLKQGAVFRLSADALERTYQVEIGTVLWTLPATLQCLRKPGQDAGWLRELGPRGPWVVERIVGMREFPQDMGTDGKVAMIEQSVRRACQDASGEVDVKLHQHVCGETRVWCSDGADLGVPLAASASFPNLTFHAWDESHSAQRLCANAMIDDHEIIATDRLLVTGKRPYSLAKFLSTSMVFQKKVGDACIADEVSWVRNFGWAPQRFNSRARPYARASRRWKSIFEAVAAEAESANQGRRELARMYLRELGGENSSRLVLGGLLADLSAEHYSWVASGDASAPDATAVSARADAFLTRLTTLFDDAMILTLPDTYTGVTLQFLKKTSYYHIGAAVQTVGIGDWNSDESARAVIHHALGRVQVLVANMRELMKLYRPDHSWLHAFTAFRLPSPLAASDGGGGADGKTEALHCLKRICEEAGLPVEQACAELATLLPRAEKFYKEDACQASAAWGRASAEWPELQSARRLVELCLVWKTSTGNLERRFRRFREIRCPERARLLDVTVEGCVLVEQAPSSRMLQQDEVLRSRYCEPVLKLNQQLNGCKNTRRRIKQRRDAGVPRVAAAMLTTPNTEAAFGRKREAAIAEVVAESPSKRAHRIDQARPGLAMIAREAAEAIAIHPAAASAIVIERVAKRAVPIRERDMRGALAAAKGRAKREQTTVQSSTANRRNADRAAGSAPTPGIMLVRLSDAEAVQKARRLRFRLTSDPVDFVAQVASAPGSRGLGHVVLTPPATTDFAVCAAFAAAFMGCFQATAQDFMRASPRGVTYVESFRDARRDFRIAVSADLAAENPTLPPLVRGIAQAPGSRVRFYQSERKLHKYFKRQTKDKGNRHRWRVLQATAVLTMPGHAARENAKVRALYITPREFLLRQAGSLSDLCPGCPAAAPA